jgi:hypothetical protein
MSAAQAVAILVGATIGTALGFAVIFLIAWWITREDRR